MLADCNASWNHFALVDSSGELLFAKRRQPAERSNGGFRCVMVCQTQIDESNSGVSFGLLYRSSQHRTGPFYPYGLR